jgi:hypothetical protein
MHRTIPLHEIVFLDIETAAAYPTYEALPESWKQLWARKSAGFRDPDPPEESYRKAGIYAEFGKVICVVVAIPDRFGAIHYEVFDDPVEAALLRGFGLFLHSAFRSGRKWLCAHNGKEFDFPFLARRMLVNGLPLPEALDTAGRKPWEVQHLDTMELWKFGDYKAFTSLALLAQLFNLPCPKDDLDGSRVGETYWVDRDLPRIVRYCRKDVETLVQVYQRMRGSPVPAASL